jgi:flagellar protein FlaG
MEIMISTSGSAVVTAEQLQSPVALPHGLVRDPGAAKMASEAGGLPPTPPPRIDFDAAKVRENLKAAIEDLNKQLVQSGRSLGFSMDDVLNTPVVKVHNTVTGEVVRQIPSEAVIRVAHTLDRLKGLLYDSST